MSLLWSPVIRNYPEDGTIFVRKCHTWKDCCDIYSIFSQIQTDFEPVQGPCTKNVRNEPLHDMACAVKCEIPPEWRWKLCDFQHGKRISVLGINLIVSGLRG